MNRMNDLNCLLAEKLVEDIKKDYEASGIAVAIIDKSGKTQYEKFWGVRDLESGKEVNGDTIFGLASVTKSFTALSIMQLEEKGMEFVTPDDPQEWKDAAQTIYSEFTEGNEDLLQEIIDCQK